MRYGTDDVYTSRWVYYDRLSFLENYLVAKSGSNAMVSPTSTSSDGYWFLCCEKKKKMRKSILDAAVFCFLKFQL